MARTVSDKKLSNELPSNKNVNTIAHTLALTSYL